MADLPKSPVIDVAEIVSKFDTVTSMAANFAGTVDAAMQDHAAAAGSEQAAIMEEGRINAFLQSAVDSYKIEKGKKNLDAAAFFGTNPDASNFVVAELAQELSRREATIQEGMQAFKEKASVGFTDDPLQWLINQFTLPQEAYALNVEMAKTDRMRAHLGDILAKTQETVKVNNAIAAETTAEISSLAMQQHLVKAQRLADAAKQQAITAGVNFGSVRLAANQKQFDNFLSFQRSLIDLQQLDIQHRQLELSEENLNMRRKEFDKQLDEWRKKDEYDANLQKLLDSATAATGHRKISVMEYNKMSDKERDRWRDIMADPALQYGRLGNDPIRALTNIAEVNAPLNGSQNIVKDVITRYAGTASEGRHDWNTLKPEDRVRAQIKAIQARVESELKDIPDSGGLFSAPPLKALDSIPAVKATVLWRAIYAPLAQNQNVPLRAQDVYDNALTLVEKGNIKPQDAAREIATIYRAAVSDNHTHRQYSKFAIKLPDRYRNSYFKTIDTGSKFGFGGVDSIDLTNETVVLNSMLRTMNARGHNQRLGAFVYDSRMSGRPHAMQQQPGAENSENE